MQWYSQAKWVFLHTSQTVVTFSEYWTLLCLIVRELDTQREALFPWAPFKLAAAYSDAMSPYTVCCKRKWIYSLNPSVTEGFHSCLCFNFNFISEMLTIYNIYVVNELESSFITLCITVFVSAPHTSNSPTWMYIVKSSCLCHFRRLQSAANGRVTIINWLNLKILIHNWNAISKWHNAMYHKNGTELIEFSAMEGHFVKWWKTTHNVVSATVNSALDIIITNLIWWFLKLPPDMNVILCLT